MQVNEVVQLFIKADGAPLKSMAVYGGASINPQMMGMNRVNLLIATPGRLIELLDANALHLEELQTFVLDEADKMLNLGFRAELENILKRLPSKRQNLLFSATLSKEVSSIENLVLNDAIQISIEPEKENIELIQQSGYNVKTEKKGPLLRHLIESMDMQQVLVLRRQFIKRIWLRTS